MGLRLISAAVGLPILIAAIWAGTPWLTVVIGLVALLGIWEFTRLASGVGAQVPLPLAAALTLALAIHSELPPQDRDLLLPLVGGGAIVSGLWFLVAGQRRGLADWAFTLAGALYVGLLLSHALLLRQAAQGRDWLLFALLTTFAADTGAYFTGRLLGRRPLAPTISPRKTQEGAVGGLVWAVGVALLLGLVLDLQAGAWVQGLLGLLVALLALAGDLVESKFKRAAGVKDAGGIIPGHGGVLDRLDSVVFTIPVVYYFVVLVLD